MPALSDRRTVLAALGAATFANGLIKPGTAQAAATGPLSAAVDFLGKLSPEGAERARFAFGDDVHRRWNFMGTGVKPGLPLELMNQAEKDAAHALLQTLLSPHGYDKARMIMLCQDVMRELDSGPQRARRSQQRALFHRHIWRAGGGSRLGVAHRGPSSLAKLDPSR